MWGSVEPQWALVALEVGHVTSTVISLYFFCKCIKFSLLQSETGKIKTLLPSLSSTLLSLFLSPLGTIPGGDEAFLYEFLLQGHTSEPRSERPPPHPVPELSFSLSLLFSFYSSIAT